MSDTSQGPGWWLASDGKWYPPQPAAAPPPPPTPAPAAPIPPPAQWTPPPGFVPPPPPPGYVPPAGITEIIETPVSPFRRSFFTVLFVVVLLVFEGGGIVLGVQAFLQQNQQINDLARGPVPVAVLELEADARETIHLEADHLGDGDSESPSPRAERLKAQALSARITVTGPGPDGPSLPIEDVAGESVYGFGHEGIAVARIAVPEDGEYRVDVQGFDVEGAAVAIGDVSFGALFKDFGIGLAMFIFGIFLLIPVWRARTPKAVRRARRLG